VAEPILLDTDVAADFLRGVDRAVSFVRSQQHRIILSSIVVAELYAGVMDREEEVYLANFVSLFPVVPVTTEIAKQGGLLKRDYGESHGVGLADAIIAAMAEAYKAELKTLNVRHYPMFKGLKAAYVRD
jgi:predicted nucleic acid-binding protein